MSELCVLSDLSVRVLIFNKQVMINLLIKIKVFLYKKLYLYIFLFILCIYTNTYKNLHYRIRNYIFIRKKKYLDFLYSCLS